MPGPADDAANPTVRRAPGLNTIGAAGALALLAWLVASVVLVLQTKGRELALEEAWKRVESSGAAGVAEIGARAREVAALARSLAEALEHLPLDEAAIRAGLPPILDFQGDRAIAGGGYWPEPFAFDPAQERRAFFWGRNAAGALEYFDDYNASETGYHREEWYVPARYLERGRVYWSRTYMDPFTRQPMVTCTAPVFRDGAFHGAVTVDLRLEGLQSLAAAVTQRTGGYAFVLGSFGRFITFPEPSLVTRDDGERLTVRELAATEPGFEALVEATQLDEVLVEATQLDEAPVDATQAPNEEPHAEPGDAHADVANELSARSPQIDPTQAAIVAAMLEGDRDDPGVRRLSLAHDPRLGEASEVFVFRVPETWWRLVVVKPVSEGAAVASRLVRILAAYLAVGLALALGIAYLAVDRLLIRPLRRTTSDVQEAGQLLADGRFAALEEHHVVGGGAREVEVLASVLNALAHTVGRVTSDLDRARDAAESASRAKSEFLAAMSHELRTPLNQILGYAELLEEEAQDAGREEELPDLRRIHGAASGLLRMVDDALAISQMESDKLELSTEPVDAWDLAEEVVGALRPLAERNGNALSFARPDSDGRAETDVGKLRACLRHLVDNACGFTRDGRVEVVASSEDVNGERVLVFRVRDTGPGIPADKHAEIFERFTQLDRSSTRTRDGAGLGLAVVRGYTEALGGWVEVESEVGKGSVFTLRIPARLPARG